MRCIDADALIKQMEADAEQMEDPIAKMFTYAAINDVKHAPTIEPEPCEDAVSRHRLLNDLKELIAAWEKYPVMAEEIKGVEAAIGYVKTIPSVTPLPKPYRKEGDHK